MSYQRRDYDPVLGRWTTRDPIEEKGGENLYGACQNNFISKYDALGKYTLEQALTTYFFESYNLSVSKYNPQQPINDYNSWKAKLSEQDVFDIWIAIESRDISWVKILPKCPERVCKNGGNYFIDPQKDVDISQWLQPTAAGYFTHKYHTGAARVELRSRNICGHSNQCIYVTPVLTIFKMA